MPPVTTVNSFSSCPPNRRAAITIKKIPMISFKTTSWYLLYHNVHKFVNIVKKLPCGYDRMTHMAKLYITIKQAAKILEVTPLTLRNWDKNGKLKAHRHPMNNYRVYKIEDLEKVIREIETNAGLRKSTKQQIHKLIVKHLEE